MSSILLVTSRNVVDENGNSTGVGAATLIFRRATSIYKKVGMQTDIYAINGNPIKKSTGYEGVNFIVRKKNNIEELINYIESKKPKYIIYSGDKAYLLHNRIKKSISSSTLIYLDIHGALEEGIEYSEGIKYIKTKAKYFIRKSLFKNMVKKADGLLVVSDEMYNHYMKITPQNLKNKIKKIKIRCGVVNTMTTDIKMKSRNKIRKKWGINNSTKVFVYSGYRANWQCIDEIIKFFEEVDKKEEDVFFAFFTSEDINFVNKLEMIFKRQNYFVGLVKPQLINEYLSACDVGMLVRHENFTNEVAFPNKFSDYVNAGLQLGISESLKEPVRILKEYNVPYLSIEAQKEYSDDLNLEVIDNRLDNLEEYYQLTQNVTEEELVYSKQIEHIEWDL